MSNLYEKSLLALCATLAIGVTAYGCGGDSKKASSDGTGGTDLATTTGGTGAGAGGTSGIGTGMSTGGTGTGGTAATGTGAAPALPMAMCDTAAPATATCGGTTCPASGMFAAFTCTVPCCTAADECGTQTAMLNMPKGACAAGAVPDANCPGYTGMAMGMPITLPGCCTSAGVCGAISTISMTCITSSMFLTDLAPGGPCDGSSDADAGI